MRDYQKEYEWQKQKYFWFRTLLDRKFEEEFRDVPRADFLRWCVERGIVQEFKETLK